MDIFLWLSAGHFLGDFAFQSAWMAESKKTSWEINAYHAATYTATVMAVAALGGFYLTSGIIGLFFISHFFIDPLKARWGLIRSIWQDQLLHFLIIFMATAMLK